VEKPSRKKQNMNEATEINEYTVERMKSRRKKTWKGRKRKEGKQ
jgi:hypothetical protein